MKRLTHLAVGITAGFIVAHFFKKDELIFMAAGGFFGILPDFDIALSALGIARHRGAYSHSLGSSLAVAAITFAVIYLALDWRLRDIALLSCAAFIAAFLHTAADTLTRGGTKLLYPLTAQEFRGPMKYDSWGINMALILLCALLIIYFKRGLFIAGL